jgi:hypothetical protein
VIEIDQEIEESIGAAGIGVIQLLHRVLLRHSNLLLHPNPLFLLSWSFTTFSF